MILLRTADDGRRTAPTDGADGRRRRAIASTAVAPSGRAMTGFSSIRSRSASRVRADRRTARSQTASRSTPAGPRPPVSRGAARPPQAIADGGVVDRQRDEHHVVEHLDPHPAERDGEHRYQPVASVPRSSARPRRHIDSTSTGVPLRPGSPRRPSNAARTAPSPRTSSRSAPESLLCRRSGALSFRATGPPRRRAAVTAASASVAT